MKATKKLMCLQCKGEMYESSLKHDEMNRMVCPDCGNVYSFWNTVANCREILDIMWVEEEYFGQYILGFIRR